MESSKRILLTTIGIALILVTLVGVTYSFFNYTKTGSSNVIRVGRIYFNTEQNDTINLTNLFPIDSSEASTNTEYTDEASISITGDTIYNNGIEYVVKVVDFNNLVNDKKLPISILTTVNGIGDEDTDYFDDRDSFVTSKYTILNHDQLENNDDLVIGYIAKGTTGIDGTVTIKAFVDKDKIAITDTYPAGITYYVNENMTNEELANCINKVKQIFSSQTDEVYENYCLGTGVLSSKTFYEHLNDKSIWYTPYNNSYKDYFISNNIIYTIEDGTTEDWVNGRVVFTTDEWNAIQTNGVSFKIKVEANEGIWVNDPSMLYNIMSKNAVIDNTISTYVTSSSGIDFSKPSGDTDNDNIVDNGKGTYVRAGTENNDNPIIYYRGDVDDNNVYFGGFCWKIVRTSENGGIKMIYNGTNVGTQNNPNCNVSSSNTLAVITVNNEEINWIKFNDEGYLPTNGYMYGDDYPHDTNYLHAYYGNSFNYVDGLYQLTDPIMDKDDYHHYTCGLLDQEEKCSTLYYYYQGINRLILTNGDGVEEALSQMQENKYDSKLKDFIDTWYEQNLTSYGSKLEDAIWCNDRRMITTKADGEDYIRNSWYANGGKLDYDLNFLPYYRTIFSHVPDLSCRKNDAFTVNESNDGNGALDYKIATITSDESVLAGSNYGGGTTNFYLYNGNAYWTMSPYFFSAYNYARGIYLTSSGGLLYSNIFSGLEVRPMVSLKNGTKISGGNGTTTNPYVVE